jgi:hypothetical protein
MHATRQRTANTLETLDVGIGIIGFFAFAFLVITIICELTGTDALGWALALLAFVLVLAALLVSRRRISQSQSTSAPTAPSATDPRDE